MTVPDPTTSTAEDVIAEATHAAIFDYSRTDAWPILGDDARAADFIAAGVVAAIRHMSVRQQAELLGGEIESDWDNGGPDDIRACGPWRDRQSEP